MLIVGPWFTAGPSTILISLARVIRDSTICTRVGMDSFWFSQGHLASESPAGRARPPVVAAAGAPGVASASRESVRDAVAARASAAPRNRNRDRGQPGQLLRGSGFIDTSVNVLDAEDSAALRCRIGTGAGRPNVNAA